MMFWHLLLRVTGEVYQVLKPECPSSQSPAAAAINTSFREVDDVKAGALPDSGCEIILKFSVVRKTHKTCKPMWAYTKLYSRVPQKGCALLPTWCTGAQAAPTPSVWQGHMPQTGWLSTKHYPSLCNSPSTAEEHAQSLQPWHPLKNRHCWRLSI